MSGYLTGLCLYMSQNSHMKHFVTKIMSRHSIFPSPLEPSWLTMLYQNEQNEREILQWRLLTFIRNVGCGEPRLLNEHNGQFSIHSCSNLRLGFQMSRLRQVTGQMIVYLSTPSLGIKTFYRTSVKKYFTHTFWCPITTLNW